MVSSFLSNSHNCQEVAVFSRNDSTLMNNIHILPWQKTTQMRYEPLYLLRLRPRPAEKRPAQNDRLQVRESAQRLVEDMPAQPLPLIVVGARANAALT